MVTTVRANGREYTDDSNPLTGMGNGGHRTRLMPMLNDVMADTAASLATIQSVAQQVAANQTAAKTSENNAKASENAAKTSETNASTQANTAANAAATATSAAALATAFIGTAQNVIAPVINYRLASAWDSSGQPTAYALSNVVAVHRYDTRKDSDGGKWTRGRIARQSTWYNEALFTSTRGSRREFPVVALIVVTQTMAVIYDAYDLDINGSPKMWMVFSHTNGALAFAHPTWSYGGVAARNGLICFANNGTGGIGLFSLDFLRDAAYRTHTGGKVWRCALGNRNTSVGSETAISTSITLAGGVVYGVDMRVFPGAPIDPVSRLPIPTVAVATAGGVSVIHPTGLVANITGLTGTAACRVALTDTKLYVTQDGSYRAHVGPIPYVNTTPAAWGWTYSDTTTPAISISWKKRLAVGGGLLALGDQDGTRGLTLISEDAANPANGMVSYVTKDYSTGWLPGDTRLATLSDGAGTNGSAPAELFGNGDFASSTGWTMNGSWGIDTTNKVANCGATAGWLKKTVSLVPGGIYTFTFDATFTNGGYAVCAVFDADGASNQINVVGSAYVNGTHNLTVVAGATSTMAGIYFSGGSGNGVAVRNFKLRRVGTYSDAIVGTGELVTNGDGSTTTGWTAANSASLSVANGYIRVTNGAASPGQSRQALSTVPGETYLITFTWSNGTSTNNPGALIGTSAGIADLGLIVGTGSGGTVSGQFRAVGTTTYLSFQGDATSGRYFDVKSISCKIATADRSYKSKGLVVNGTLTRAPVATGADLYELSGFSASSFLEQPYNPDLDVGTGDLCIIMRAGSNVANGYFFNRAGASGARINITANSNKVAFDVNDGTNGAVVYSTTDFSGPMVRHTWAFVARRALQRLEIWCDGVLEATASCASVGSLTNTSAKLRVGEAVTPAAGTAATGLSISLLRFAAYAPTPAQIAKLATDEGAAATGRMFLGGSSSNVQSLSLDEDTGILSVATADGLDQFAGLRRIGRITPAAQALGAEKVTNGTFDTNVTGWSPGYAGVGVDWVTGQMRVTSAGAYSDGKQTISGLTVGKQYLLVATVSGGTGPARFGITDKSGGWLTQAAATAGATLYACLPFTADATSANILCRSEGSVGQTAFFDNVSLKEIGAVSVSSMSAVSAGNGAVLIGTANEAGIVTELLPLRTELLPVPANSNEPVFEFTTTDATAVDIGKIFVGEGESVQIEAEVEATEYGLTPAEGASFILRARVRRNLGGNVQIMGTPFLEPIDRTTGTIAATISVDTAAQAFGINVVGKASTRLKWRAVVRRLNWISETRNAA